ncbi:hypothetical protein D9758_004120 [Tetrapyrgos nigripes]|uniref:PCI domain-containing protein n=1 Tax=Tetrapyrgos nigripes TaxID=182062 RepID=A0A8H5GUN0_9AGAR|nr:hypothetical protein D9758_004120 [Tetrapyrgos nigripes]
MAQNRGWTLPALFSILRDLRDLAFDADVWAKHNNQKSECMEDAARTIAKAFGGCVTDRTSPPDQSRKWGVYYVVGLVLKCYFKIKRISLSKNVLRALEANKDIPDLSLYPRSHQVTFRYYLGMLSFLNEDYAKVEVLPPIRLNAEQELTIAFYHCHIGAQANQERILTYLLPLRLLKGHLPSDELLARFPVIRELFWPFISAIRNGEVSAFDRALETWEKKLLELNLWLTLEKAREICMRGLFRKVYVASNNSSRIPISLFHSGLRIAGVNVEQEEAECLVANMIYKGFMRGYISHEKQMVVLANTNAFPRLADRASPFEYSCIWAFATSGTRTDLSRGTFGFAFWSRTAHDSLLRTMEKGLPVRAPIPPERRSKRSSSLLRVVSLVSLVVVCVYTGLATRLSWSIRTSSTIPINAAQILDKCANLDTLPGPPPDFYSRKESDRFEPGTKPVLIKRATIWTGERNGTEIVTGDVLLDKGMIKAFGHIKTSTILKHGHVEIIDAAGAWLTPGIVDLHSHLGVDSSPELSGADDTNSRKGLVQPWLRSLDGLNTHDDAYRLSISGGVTTANVLPGSANSIGGQAFVIKLRPTSEKSPSSMLLEPPFSFNGSSIEPFHPPRWRQLKQACGENPSRVYSGTRMDNIWSFRQGYEIARKIKVQQDQYCEKAMAGQWQDLGEFPEDLQWEALVDVLRGRVKIQNHCYEAVDLDGIVRLMNEFKFSIAAFHHAHETYLVPDLLKKAYGHPPAVALFATNGRYKREAYRGSEFAPKVLAANGLDVVMKSDHPVLNSRYLLYEAQQAHYFGLADNLALASVITTPARIMGQDHRIGYVKEGYDADLVLWDSHPLSLGATPKQVFIDGIAQLKEPHTLTKPSQLQKVPVTPNFAREAEEAVRHDGLPPLGPRESFKKEEVVMFVNMKSMYAKLGGRVVKVLSARTEDAERSRRMQKEEMGVVIVQGGELLCKGIWAECAVPIKKLKSETRIVDLKGGSLAEKQNVDRCSSLGFSPGLVSYGSYLGLTHISGERSTNDGTVADPLTGSVPGILGGGEAVIRAVDGLQFESRNALLAYRSGVTSAITPPQSSGILAGLSAALSTGASNRLAQGAVLQEVSALHVGLTMGSSVSVSTQITALRKLLLGGTKGDLGSQIDKVVNGTIPLVVTVHSADIMASLILLKKEVEAESGNTIKMTFAGASEAHLLAKEIGEVGVGVIISPVRPFPGAWERARILPGPPLTQDTGFTKLIAHNVTVGIGAADTWMARNTRFDVAWVSLDSAGQISEADAIGLASANIEKLLGTDTEDGTNTDWVATRGGSLLDFEAKVVGVVSSRRGVVDLF